MLPVLKKLLVAKLYNSALVAGPAIKTDPSGSSVAVSCSRSVVSSPVAVEVVVAGSYSSATRVAPSASRMSPLQSH